MRWGTILLLLCVALVLVDAKKKPGKKGQCKNVAPKNFPKRGKGPLKEYEKKLEKFFEKYTDSPDGTIKIE